MLPDSRGHFHGMVIVGLLLALFIIFGTHSDIDDPVVNELECGSGNEYEGFQLWEDRKPFMKIIEGPEDVPGFGLYGSNLGDINGDGCDDFVSMDYRANDDLPSWSFGDTIILPGRSDGDFERAEYEDLDIGYLTFACGDVNGDGYADAISVHRRTNPREDFRHNITFEIRFGGTSGIGTQDDQYFIITPFSEGSTEYRNHPSPTVYPVGDVNGDGFDDVMVFGLVETKSDQMAEFQVFHGTSEGLGTEPGTTHAVSLDTPKVYMMWNWSRQALSGDFNGDGYSDVIIGHGEPRYHHVIRQRDYFTVHMGSSEGFSPTPDLSLEQARPDHRAYAIGPMDLNGDQYDDLAIVVTPPQDSSPSSEMYVYFHTGTSEGLSEQKESNRSVGRSDQRDGPHFSFSDLDGDGFDDLLITNNHLVEETSNYEFFPNYYDRHLTLWRNEGGTFGRSPWWSTVVSRDTGDHVKVHRGDYDGDGQGDFLITLSGWGYITTDYPTPSGDGKVVLLLGRNSEHIASPIFMKEGPILYANYTSYEFIIEKLPMPGMELEAIEVTLDSQREDVMLRFIWINGTDQDDIWLDLIRSATLFDITGYGIIRDEKDNSSWVNLSITFGWDWPHEDPCDIEISYEYRTYNGGLKTHIVTVPAVFSVENDLDLVGDLVVKAEFQGILEEGDWVRGGEALTVYGLRVVYQGTNDTYPPAGVCEVVVFDDEENFNIKDSSFDEDVVIPFTVDETTDINDTLSITLQALPGLAKGPAPLTFSIKIDADPPDLRKPIPDGDEWISAYPVMVGITADDTGTSGVDASSLEFSFRGSFDYGGWSRTDVFTTPNGPLVDGIAYLTLQDGDDYYLKWRVRDLVGNSRVMSDEIRLRVDTQNVTFTDSIPSSDDWFNISRLMAGVTVTDVVGSGIDVTTIQYRVSHHNLSGYGEWMDYTGQHTDAREVDARVYVDLGEGPYNYIQWRAADIAGNGLTVSGHFRVRVDTTPPSFLGFAPRGIQNTTEVDVSVLLDDGPLGIGVVRGGWTIQDPIDFYYRVRMGDGPYGDWMVSGVVLIEAAPGGEPSIPIITYSSKMCYLTATLTGLAEGGDNYVQFMASDRLDNGPALSEEYRIFVDTEGPYFYNITPQPEDVLPHTEVAVSMMIRDTLSGVDIDRVQFRYGTEGEASLGEWLRMPVEIVDDQYRGMVTITLNRGKANYIQFRAVDLVGNVNESTPKMVWVNRFPMAVIANPTDVGSYSELDHIRLDPEGSIDPDGDDLTFTWLLAGEGRQEVYDGDRMDPLRPGVYNLTLVVTDIHGAEARTSVQITVEAVDEGLSGFLVGLLLVSIVIIVVALVVVYLRFREDEITDD